MWVLEDHSHGLIVIFFQGFSAMCISYFPYSNSSWHKLYSKCLLFNPRATRWEIQNCMYSVRGYCK